MDIVEIEATAAALINLAHELVDEAFNIETALTVWLATTGEATNQAVQIEAAVFRCLAIGSLHQRIHNNGQ
jgi:hypothetical protein